MHRSRCRRRAPWPVLLLAGALLGGVGCSRGGGNGNFTFASRAGDKNLSQHFNSAYITSGRDGEYDLVLLNDELQSARPQLSRKPLDPIPRTPLRQVLRVHVFWKAGSGNVVREASVTNASVDWCLFGNDENRAGDLLRYEGAAYVRIQPGAGGTQVTVRNGQVKRTALKGDLQDAIGPSVIAGQVFAVRNEPRVREVLRTLDDQLNGRGPGIPATNPVAREGR